VKVSFVILAVGGALVALLMASGDTGERLVSMILLFIVLGLALGHWGTISQQLNLLGRQA